MATPVLSDLALAKRLERAEGTANARFVESHSRLTPDAGAQWMEVNGAYAMFDGVGSPCTQTFGLGLFAPASDAGMDELEKFFKARGAAVVHEVSPLTDASTAPLLNRRGYRPIEFTSVMYLPLDERSASASKNAHLHVRIAQPAERDLWARTAADGWREYVEFAALIRDFGRVTAAAEGCHPFLAEWDGQAIATGALVISGDIGLLAGASTVPEWRNRGAQRALLESRLDYAASSGCDLAMMCAAPGSSSQRNAERQGFRIAYTRIKWELPAEA